MRYSLFRPLLSAGLVFVLAGIFNSFVYAQSSVTYWLGEPQSDGSVLFRVQVPNKLAEHMQQKTVPTAQQGLGANHFKTKYTSRSIAPFPGSKTYTVFSNELFADGNTETRQFISLWGETPVGSRYGYELYLNLQNTPGFDQFFKTWKTLSTNQPMSFTPGGILGNTIVLKATDQGFGGMTFSKEAMEQFLPTPPTPLPKLEEQFLAELKLMRKDPAQYAIQNLDPMANSVTQNGSYWSAPIPGTDLSYKRPEPNLRAIIIEASNEMKSSPKNMNSIPNAKLVPYARDFSVDWSRQPPETYRAHIDSKGRGFFERFESAFGHRNATENTVNQGSAAAGIRKDFAKFATIAWLIDEFADNRGHRKAMLNPRWNFFGMGIEIHNDMCYGTLWMAATVPGAQNPTTHNPSPQNPVPANLNSTPSNAANIKDTDEFWIVNRTTNLVLVAKNGIVVMEPKNTKQESLWRLRKGADRTYQFVNVKTGKLLGTDWKTEPKLVPKLVDKGELIEWDLRTEGLLRLTSLGGEPLMYHENRLDWAISTRDPRIDSGGKWNFVINR